VGVGNHTRYKQKGTRSFKQSTLW